MWRFVPIIVVSILGGLAIYNTFFALLGSLISRQEDAAQVILPVFIPLVAGSSSGKQAVIGNAETPLVKALTWFPLTAPMLLPVRVARDAIALWEIILALGLMALGVWLLVRIAGRVYEFTLLESGRGSAAAPQPRGHTRLIVRARAMPCSWDAANGVEYAGSSPHGRGAGCLQSSWKVSTNTMAPIGRWTGST